MGVGRLHNVGVVRIGRCVGAVAVVTASLSGCGGSSKTHTTSARIEFPSALVASSLKATTVPPSHSGPMTCTVYESGYATQVIFASRSFDVRAVCGAWTRTDASEGYLWGFQPSSAAAMPAEAIEVCHLTDPAGRIAARVIEATGFRSVSPKEAARGRSACVSLVGIGWTRVRNVSRRAHRA